MNLSRRKLFGLGAAVAATAAVPSVSFAVEDKKVIGPVLLERECDGGKGELSKEEIASILADRLLHGTPIYWGCGTRFRWYFGSGCQCPECGRLYLFTTDMHKSGKYNVKS